MAVPGDVPPLLVISDLDGTLLDQTTYAFDEAREALDALRARFIPLVLATSKTLAEVEPLTAAMGWHPTLIVENGGAVVISPIRRVGSADKDQKAAEEAAIQLGVQRELLIQQLAEIARETHTSLSGFNQLPVAEIARLTGLSAEDTHLACDRRYDEPFLIDREDRLPLVAEAARRRNLSVTTGGRFHHLTGRTDKGLAFQFVLERFAGEGRRFDTVGLGDAPNDLPFLRLVNRPILVPRPDNAVDPALAAALPHAEWAPCPGPRGWNAAVLAVLSGQCFASVDGTAR
jgi:mannosyl-3-phosphoglycerate phosphatase